MTRGCCQRTHCATCLAESHPAGGTYSTIHLGDGLALVPDYARQELVAAFVRAAYERGLAMLNKRRNP